MEQQLYLLRHAEANPWSPLGNDFSRALSPGGKHHAEAIAEWATRHLQLPDTVLCSPAKRTRETLAPLLSAWPQLLATTDYVDSSYGASLDMLLTLAEDAFSYSQRVLMVGHNPGLENMLTHFLRAEQVSGMGNMAPGTLAVISFSGGYKTGSNGGVLTDLIRRQDLSFDL